MALLPLLLTGLLISAFGGFGGDDDETETRTSSGLRGTQGDDQIAGTEADEEIVGKEGDDYLDGWGGNDSVYGQEGDDLIYGGEGNDYLRGGAGNDVIFDLEGSDLIKAGAGNDMVIASTMSANINLSGDSTDAPQWDYSEGDFEGDDIYLGDGDDYALIGFGDRVLDNSIEGADTIAVAGAQQDHSYDEAPEIAHFDLSNDTIEILYYTETPPVISYLVDETGAVEIFADNQIAVHLGEMLTEDADLLALSLEDRAAAVQVNLVQVYGSQPVVEPDPVTGSDGDDTLVGTLAEDEINAKQGDDLVLAEDGSDTVYGSDGNDTVYGGAGADYLRGGNGDDAIIDLQGHDTIVGGAGNDTVIASGALDNLDPEPEDASALWDYSEGDTEGDIVYLGKGDDYGEVGLYDTITGGEGADAFGVIALNDDAPDSAAPILTDFTPAEDVLVLYYTNGVEPVVSFALGASGSVEVLADGQVAAQLTSITSLSQTADIEVTLISVYGT